MLCSRETKETQSSCHLCYLVCAPTFCTSCAATSPRKQRKLRAARLPMPSWNLHNAFLSIGYNCCHVNGNRLKPGQTRFHYTGSKPVTCPCEKGNRNKSDDDSTKESVFLSFSMYNLHITVCALCNNPAHVCAYAHTDVCKYSIQYVPYPTVVHQACIVHHHCWDGSSAPCDLPRTSCSLTSCSRTCTGCAGSWRWRYLFATRRTPTPVSQWSRHMRTPHSPPPQLKGAWQRGKGSSR